MSHDPHAAAGWAALRAARWAEARDAFEAALAEGESAGAYEGLSWAAWWLDDAARVFAAREAAFARYRAAGDAYGAARMATWLGVDALDFDGARSVANGWLRRAERLLAPLEPGPEHGWLAFHLAYLAHGAGASERARALAGEAADLGRHLGVPDLEMLGLALEGSVLVDCARVDEGMRLLDEAAAAALAGEATIPISGAWVCCFLVGACTAVLDYERAFAWCERIDRFAERYGSRYMLAFCRGEYGEVHLWRGEWRQAEAMLAASANDFRRSRPAWAAGPLVRLAELRRRQGRRAEALALLERVGPSASAELCRARLALDAGEPARAAVVAERLLRRVPDERGVARLPVLQVLIAAAAACGDHARAAAAVAALRGAATAARTASLRAVADLAEARLAGAAGEHERACRLLEDAADGFAQVGAVYDAACARVELACVLAARGDRAAAEREARAAHAVLEALGAGPEAERARALFATVAPATAAREVTRREREVLALLVDGLTNREIAERLVISEHTVHRHITNILRKLRLPSRSAAAAHAVRAGLAEAGEGTKMAGPGDAGLARRH